ncbi:MAG: DUF4293 domain-containing protein [Bacteroidetes bacterium]|nr:DUF4293 domain-containing protein [Bacteroidota bacterium]
MLQRVQSLFLAAVAIIALVLLFVPVFYVNGKDQVQTGITLTGNILALLVNLLPAGWAVFTIFQFTNRPQQIKFCTLGMILSSLVLAADVFLPAVLFSQENSVLTFAAGIYIVPLNILLFFAASRFIRRDEELVRSADRLR